MNKFHLEVLDDKRKQLLPLLSQLKEEFYLAGGTALALQLGHRKSVDFDFFKNGSFQTSELFSRLQKIFSMHSIKKTQEEDDTLTIFINDEVKISFFSYPYDHLTPLIDMETMRLSSVTDIGCMKLSTIISRSELKDYVDLYYILQGLSLEKLLFSTQQKFPQIDRNLMLKSLVYFNDIDIAPLDFLPNKEVPLEEIKLFLEQEVEKITF